MDSAGSKFIAFDPSLALLLWAILAIKRKYAAAAAPMARHIQTRIPGIK